MSPRKNSQGPVAESLSTAGLRSAPMEAVSRGVRTRSCWMSCTCRHWGRLSGTIGAVPISQARSWLRRRGDSAGSFERLIAMGDKAPRPAVRLIVNEELDARDVRAMTETGDLRSA